MGCGGSTAGGGAAKGVVDLSQQSQTVFPKVAADTTELNISDNPLPDLNGIGQLTKLTKLDANSCAITSLTAEIGSCVELEELLLFGNKLKEVPKEVGDCAALENINFFNNQIKKLPPDLGKLTNLVEFNCAANKLMMTTDPVFAGWAKVKVLSLYDNNLVRMGSLAPLVALEELRLNGNNLEEMPTLSADGHKACTVVEVFKNRIAAIPDTYFAALPALSRLSLWGNQLKAVPPSLCDCSALVGVQLQENQLEGLPDLAWPATLETLFLQENAALTSLPPAFAELPALKRVNLKGLQLDDASSALAEKIKETCLAKRDGIFWGRAGDMLKA